MNIKELIVWTWQHKWWFVISLVLCLGLGALYFFSKTPVYTVRSAIMLRTPDVKTQQGELMSLMGADANKSASDEIEVLTSRDIMEQIVDSLHLTLVAECRDHLRWVPIFPYPDFVLAYDQPVKKKTIVRFTENGKKYRITLYPRIAAIDMNMKSIEVKRLARESQVIVLTKPSSNPAQAVAILNMLLELYNQADTKDRNKMALQTQTFLDERVASVQTSLNDIEMNLERYKSEHQITDLEETASQYREMIEKYQLEASNIDFILSELKKIDNQLNSQGVLNNTEGIYTTLDTCNLQAMFQDYNAQVASYISLAHSAKEDNPVVHSNKYLLAKQRENIQRACNEINSSLSSRKKYIEGQIDKYSSLLAQLPEQERYYLMMEREKESMEEQYVYLIQKREENLLNLNSSSLPAKLVESPRMSADVITPKIYKIGFRSIVIGLLLPFLIFFFGYFKREYLNDIK